MFFRQRPFSCAHWGPAESDARGLRRAAGHKSSVSLRHSRATASQHVTSTDDTPGRNPTDK